MTLRTISYGGGVQSTALVVLAAQGIIDYPVALFANVGDDSEHPATTAYVRDVAMRWAAEHGVTIHEIQRLHRDGTPAPSLWQDTMYGSRRSVRIPVRMSNGAPGNRGCTGDYKIKVVARWLKEHGATAANPAVLAIGFSTDEIERANSHSDFKHQIKAFPLLDLGLDRSACQQVIRDAGLSVPPKSACFFCPFHRMTTWQEMARNEPDLFAKSVELERVLNERRAALGKDAVWLTRYNKPLDQVANDNQQAMDFEGPETCDSGNCFT